LIWREGNSRRHSTPAGQEDWSQEGDIYIVSERQDRRTPGTSIAFLRKVAAPFVKGLWGSCRSFLQVFFRGLKPLILDTMNSGQTLYLSSQNLFSGFRENSITVQVLVLFFGLPRVPNIWSLPDLKDCLRKGRL